MSRHATGEDGKTNTVQPEQVAGDHPRSSVTERDPSRRRLLKGIAAGAPFLVTVASRPVQGAMCTPSAWVSGNLSNPTQQMLSCGGKPLRYWMTNHDNRWSTTGFDSGNCKKKSSTGICTEYAKNGTPFHSASLGRMGVFPGARFGDKTLMQVLWLDQGEDPYRIGGHVVAALLNAASRPDYGMTVDQVIDMYRQLEYQGYYQPPSGGQALFTQDVVLFIRNTFS